MVLQEQLSALGDPSGRHDADYWNQWFQIVCPTKNNDGGNGGDEIDDKTRPTTTHTVGRPKESFEWYCGPDQIIPLLKYHLQQQQKEEEVIRMVHPGSGTSLLPIELLRPEHFPNSHHVILDVSQIAIEKLNRIINNNPIDDLSKNIECHVVDLLQNQDQSQQHYKKDSAAAPPPPVSPSVTEVLSSLDNSFDCWIDKSFVDAVFSHNDATPSKTDALALDEAAAPRRLFQDCHRLLKKNKEPSSSSSFAMTISLAEDHSLRILLEPWCGGGGGWSDTLHIWEVVPMSGPLLSFCFVLHTAIVASETDQKESNIDTTLTVIWHRVEGTEEKIILLQHPHRDSVDDTTNTADAIVDSEQQQKAFQIVQRRIQQAREAYSVTAAAAAAATTTTKQLKQQQQEQRKLLVVLDIKPYNTQTELLELSRRIRQQQREQQKPQPQWLSFSPSDTTNNNNNSKGSSMEQIVPIGYGISKLRLQCLVDSDEHLEALVDELLLLEPPPTSLVAISEEEEDDDDDDEDCEGKVIQSVDVESVVTVMVQGGGGRVSPFLASTAPAAAT